MILIIIKTYQNLLLSVGIVSLLIFFIGLYFILKPKRILSKPINTPSNNSSPEKMISNKDFSAIAGDDMITTQLDLARAYIETGQISLARKILESAREQGNTTQQKEALTLLTILNR